MSASKTILVVEDEAVIAMDMESTLLDLGHTVIVAATPDEARAHLSDRIDLAIIDYHLHEATSDGLAHELRTAGIPFIICSGTAGVEELGEVFQAATFLPKPFSTDRLIDAVSGLDRRQQDA